MTLYPYYFIFPLFGLNVNHSAFFSIKMLAFNPPPPFVIEISHQQRTLAMVQAPFVP